MKYLFAFGIIFLTFLIILFTKEEKDMAMVYVSLIVKGKKKFSAVPTTIKAQVQEILLDLELDYLID